MSTVRVPLAKRTRGQFTTLRYEFHVDVRFAPSDPWTRVHSLIDTAAPFTVVPLKLIGANAVVPRIICPNPPKFQNPGDYLASLWYRFPAQFAASPVRFIEFRCDECRVTADPMHHIHLALRDIRPNFYLDTDHHTDELVLTLRPGNLGLVYASGS
jgi:hypothetical protein